MGTSPLRCRSLMTNPRFFCSDEIRAGREMELAAEAGHHAARVLRLGTGDKVVLFDGRGGEFGATITRIAKAGVVVQVGQHFDVERESPLAVVLAQALCAAEKMDLIVQKAVELGVNRIQPLATSRSIARLSPERAAKRVEHWEKVVVSACEQSGRNRVPQVDPPMPLGDWLSRRGAEQSAKDPEAAETRMLLSPGARLALRGLAKPKAGITLLVGPEGGFSPEEEAAAKAAGFVPVRLGARILRTETVALAVLSAIQSLWGDF